VTARKTKALKLTKDETANLINVMYEIRDYFDSRADAEYFTDSPIPKGNKEMDMLVMVDEVLKYFRRAK